MECIRDLIIYVERGHVSEWTSGIERLVGPARLRVVAIKLLGWLKSQNRLRMKQPLDLNMAFPWCAELKTVLAHDPGLAAIFFIASDDVLDFRSEVTEDAREEIRGEVDANYNPPLTKRTRMPSGRA